MDKSQQREIARIFLPHTVRELDRIRSANIRLAHYTSAETGLKILRSQRIILRNSTLMNDFSEVQHGLDCLNSAYSGELKDRLDTALDQIQPGLAHILVENFNACVVDVRSQTYIASVSEHGSPNVESDADTKHEDAFGRLSMWRAYAPKDGVAFILNHSPFVAESDALKAYTSPVVYVTHEQFRPYFEEVVNGIEVNCALLSSLGGSFVHEYLMMAFRFSVQSTKHPSFKEEREWRIIFTPTLLNLDDEGLTNQAERMPSEIMSIGGVPQRTYAIPFQDYPDEGFVGATAPALIDRVLIGPSRDAYEIREAYIAELAEVGVPDAPNKVLVTGVPLRH